MESLLHPFGEADRAYCTVPTTYPYKSKEHTEQQERVEEPRSLQVEPFLQDGVGYLSSLISSSSCSSIEK